MTLKQFCKYGSPSTSLSYTFTDKATKHRDKQEGKHVTR